ncbi:TetR/AcrR family transcriptional regulator [Arthrobacter sp. L77]|uniref:TetR/AcrR family transcriptional regulator n=1 Tax=Arthrobacter sp. L77 TaxID=1496689 RepID=UPI00068B0D0B|nr:TetR/AcrR family transcriptional regulator [Arthrobacter sp. L77]
MAHGATDAAPAPRSHAGRQRYHHGDLRNALLDAGRAEARSVGAESLTLRGVARRAGVSHAAAYNHFADKNDLLRGIAIESFREFAGLIRSLDRSETELEDLGVLYTRFAFEHPVEFRFMFRRELCAPEGEPDPLAEASLDAQGAFGDRLADLQRRQVLVAGDLEPLLLAVWSQMHGLTTILLETPAFKSISQADALDLARNGMRQIAAGLNPPALPQRPPA